MLKSIWIVFLFVSFCACNEKGQQTPEVKGISSNYNTVQDTGVLNGGVKMISVSTPVGSYNVWTKRIGNNPTIKVLLLHGGPAQGHEYMEVFESFFPAASIEFYEYDQLGSSYSDQPTDSSLWTMTHKQKRFT